MNEIHLKEIEKINKMPQVETARLWRNAPSGHPYFNRDLPYFEVFDKRLKALGGITSKISKII